jgi:hypothetical protein
MFRWLHPVPPPFDAALLIGLVLLATWIAIAERPSRELAAFLAIAAGYALFDQSRWQPWFYQYLAMLAALSGFYSNSCEDRRGAALHGCRLIVVAVYFWSGIHKLNAGFAYDGFPWLLRPFTGTLPTGSFWRA